MRTTLEELIERAIDVKVLFEVACFKLSNYDDGAFVDLAVPAIHKPKELHNMIGNLEYKILYDDHNIIVRIFEDFKDF